MKYCFSIILFFFLQQLSATHVIGGNFHIEQIGRNDFKIDLIIFRDCSPGTADVRPYYATRIFGDPDSTYHINLITGSAEKIELGENCFSPPNLCIEKYIATGTITLPDNPGGYLVVAQEFARNYIITNIYSTGTQPAGMTLTANIPDPALADGNHSPLFGNYPPDGYLCLNNLREIDLSATDTDGDSLSYALVTPYDAPQAAQMQPPPPAPPYPLVTWLPGYSLSYIIDGAPTLNINSETGVVSCKPSQIGVYVFAYEVSEYRNGLKIGVVRRDLQFEVLNCTVDEPPIITAPTDSIFSFALKKDSCLSVYASDGNEEDEVKLQYSLIGEAETVNDPGFAATTSEGFANGKVCWIPGCNDAYNKKGLAIRIRATSTGCDSTEQEDTKIIYLETPLLIPRLEGLFPNVFTPNGDGLNDILRPTYKELAPCINDFEVRVFNRWGTLIYEATNNNFHWDGTYKGREAAQGVYYLVLSGSLNGIAFHKKTFVTLAR